jgi:hypothetical protein
MTSVIHTEEHGRHYYSLQLPRNNLYILVRPESEMKEDADKTNIFKLSEYFIKVKYNLHHQMKNVNYHF